MHTALERICAELLQRQASDASPASPLSRSSSTTATAPVATAPVVAVHTVGGLPQRPTPLRFQGMGTSSGDSSPVSSHSGAAAADVAAAATAVGLPGAATAPTIGPVVTAATTKTPPGHRGDQAPAAAVVGAREGGGQRRKSGRCSVGWRRTVLSSVSAIGDVGLGGVVGAVVVLALGCGLGYVAGWMSQQQQQQQSGASSVGHQLVAAAPLVAYHI